MRSKTGWLSKVPYVSFLEINTWRGIALLHIIIGAIAIFFALGGKNFQFTLTMFGLTFVSLLMIQTFSKNIEKSKFKVNFSINTHDMLVSFLLAIAFAMFLFVSHWPQMATPVFAETTAASEFSIKYQIPVLEEVVFRGGIFGTLGALYPPPVAMIVSSATFSGFHYFSYEYIVDPVTKIRRLATPAERAASGVSAFAFGMFSTIAVYLRKGNIFVGIFPHVINNIIVFSLAQTIFVLGV